MDPRPGEAQSERLGLICGPLTMDPELRKENYSYFCSQGVVRHSVTQNHVSCKWAFGLRTD
jgi:hypothetical protein